MTAVKGKSRPVVMLKALPDFGDNIKKAGRLRLPQATRCLTEHTSGNNPGLYNKANSAF
jgi:hypothetical protein